MSSEDITLVPDQRIENGLNSPLVFQDDPLRFNCPTPHHRRVGDPPPKTRELGSFIDDNKMFIDRDRFFAAAHNPEFRRYADCSARRDPRNWNTNGSATEDDDSDDDDEDDDDDEEDDTEVEGLVGDGTKSELKINNNNGAGGGGNLPAVANGKAHSYVAGRQLLVKDGGDIGQLVHSNVSGGDEDHRQEGLGKSQNSVTVAETDCEEYYSHFLQGGEGASGQKVMVDDSGCGFSGRKDAMYSSESGESLRAILSDPVTKLAALVLNPRLRNQYLPTYAYRREEESQFYRSPKRRRERFDQGGFGDSVVMEPSRSRGVQFPFAVMDRVIIKVVYELARFYLQVFLPFSEKEIIREKMVQGNKRTPQRFVGREAIVTTQCLNGWYVVKTLDNAESVKLQYRSLAKVMDDPSKPAASSKMPPNWL
ncbi:hypothetical protein JHK82_015263 [Glycine max]|nr:hypothetical protein JHK85_015644 [Glycine max]KAG5045881.1 hypothetical protein JHK86_015287 [Glycine max]KAG5148382.1 hypothetical protein JHK82_015263 [Glycine max]